MSNVNEPRSGTSDLIGYWTDAALHGGHSSWAFAFQPDGTGFYEFVNFFLVSYQPIRWAVVGGRLEVTSDMQYTIDGRTKEFTPEPCPFHAVFPFVVAVRDVQGRPTRVLCLDLVNTEADEFTKRYAPREYGFVTRITVDVGYHPTRRRP